MMMKLLPDQVAKFWSIIKYGIEQSLPPVASDHPDKMNRILTAALSNRIDVWISYNRNGSGINLNSVILTKILYDDASDTRSLLLYSLFGYGTFDRPSWQNGLEMLVKYARSQGCSYVTAYTELPSVVQIAKRLGADTRSTFLSFDVDKFDQAKRLNYEGDN